MRMFFQIFCLEIEQSDFDFIPTRVRHLRENVAELQRNYNQLTLNVKVSGNIQQANLDTVQTSINGIRFLGISKLSYWVLNAVYEFWHNNPHLKRGEELEIKFITVASEDMTNAIQYPSFHFMKLQRLDKKAFSYIKEQEMKLALVVNLTEDEISTRRAWRVWGCLTEMDKVKYPFKIYQNSVNGSFLLNTMTGITTRFANDNFEHKRAMIWKNRLIRTENIRRKACNMMHVERWYEHICQ
ncbi:hypothetical protein ACS0TY_033208 [Phlomoides rotata]